MFLKSLTLRGFKSFADKTTLEFEPGVMVVVGPNGSGKSNLVDAVAWVLGAQGPRSLRGGKMYDVIFAGTQERPALGRAEVSLTIDNASGALPIEFSEVTITRTLFRSGDSEYAINGVPCRLLDIQELLSDSGIGRQQHVIVGQGQLDTVLNARPEDRRLIIEEAAGVLKYRKRREKAERRLEATEGNLLRLNDLLREVRRGLAPLQRQADAARRHDGLVDELRAIRLHLAGHELAGLQTRTERIVDTRARLVAEDAALRAGLRELDLSVLDAERALTVAGHGDLAGMLARVEGLRERARGIGALLVEKQRSVERELHAAADEGVVENFVAESSALRAELAAVQAEAARFTARADEIAAAEAEVIAARTAFRAEETESADRGDAEAARRELAARRESLGRAEAEPDRIEARARTIAERIVALTAERATQQDRADAARAASEGLVADATAARDALEAAERGAREAEEALRRTEADASRWAARAEALALSLDSARDAAGAARIDGMPGVAGPLVDHLTIEAGTEAAVAAALGDAMRAIVVQGGDAAKRALDRLVDGDARALLLVVDASVQSVQGEMVPPGTRALVDCVRTSLPGLEPVLARLLAGHVLVDGDWARALDVALARPDVVAVTRSGDRFGGRSAWRIGTEESAGATQAALEEARERAEQAQGSAATARTALDGARAAERSAREREEAAREANRANAVALETATAALARIGAEIAEREGEQRTAEAGATTQREALVAERARIAELEAILPALETAERDALAIAEARATRAGELEAREAAVASLRRDLEVQRAAVEERRTGIQRRIEAVDERLARNPEAKAEAERRRAELGARAAAFDAVAARLAERTSLIDDALARLRGEHERRSARASEAGGRLDVLRKQRAEAERNLMGVREQAQRLEVEDAETRLRLETLVERIRAEFDCEPGAALDAPAPTPPEGTTPAGRARDLERELRIMGPINPLALEEYDALQERHDFLQQQLEDVKSSRKELQRVIRAVDLEIVTVFESAFDDVQRNFTDLFTTLFPGGSGRIFLTDPGNLLETGIEIEARPSGKNTKRLSLLSGGERSLTAMAFLFAIFRSRPSPFYLLDEVEAALDDVNLHRFLDLVHEFRDEAQLLVVSHQRRTMEAGDCMFGVSMPPGGSTRVVSQRLRGEIVLQ
ncbi:MAG: chromosome segregation protein SMC [Actinomycetes bacterium]